MTSIVFASGKGGVGKSTISLNLALLLTQAGKRVVIVDADVQMANLGLMLGIDNAPISLNNVMRGENDVSEAVYEGPVGLKYVPASISSGEDNFDYSNLKKAVQKLEETYEIVIVDCPPGLGKDAIAAMRSAREMVLVITPEPASLADALKVQVDAERSGIKIAGFILNMVLGDKEEIKPRELEVILKLKNLAVLPEDLQVRRASNQQIPVVVLNPNAPFSKSLRKFASQMIGQSIQEPKSKLGFFDGIKNFFKKLFGGKQQTQALPNENQ